MAPAAYCPRNIYCEENEKGCCQGEIGSASILNMFIWVFEFSSEGVQFLPKNQHTQRKL